MRVLKLRLLFLTLVPLFACLNATGGGADAPAPKDKKAVTGADVERWMSSLSNWGRWGKEDQRGALNLITAEKRAAAAALVKEGVSISLARPAVKQELDESPAFVHRMVAIPREGQDVASAADEYCVRYHGFTQTHIDGLCHLVYKGRMYNGYSSKELTEKGARKLGIQNFRDGVVTRCILMDIPRLLGVDYLEGTRAIYPEDLEAWERKAGVKVESGDCLLVRTGRWARREAKGAWPIMKGSAGLHASCLPWLKKRDVALVGSDLALDVLPSGVEGFELPVHWVCGVAMGTPILDNCDLEKIGAAAAARKRWAFLLMVAPLVVEGGTGSPVNPLAMY